MTEPDFTPRLDGVERAIRAGRRRRTQRHLGGAGALAAAAVVVMLVAAGPLPTDAGRDSIRIAADPTGEPTTQPGATSEPSPEPSTEPSADPSQEPGNTGGGPQPVGGGGGGGGEYADPSAGPDPDETEEPPSRVSPQPERSVVAFSAGEDCTTSSVPVATAPAWCVRYSGATTVARGAVATIAFDLCRPSADGDVTFADEDGMVMEVGNSSATMWSSQDGRKVAKAEETVTVKGGSCLRWTTTWDTRDREGFRVRAGDYYVGYGLNADSSYSGSFGGITVTP